MSAVAEVLSAVAYHRDPRCSELPTCPVCADSMVTNPPNKRRAAHWASRPHHRGLSMIKALSAIAISACVAAALTLLPGFAPKVEASVPQPLAKSDRLDIRTIGKDCSQQAWPNFEASCLRRAGTKADVREARLVTADRTP